MLADNKSPPLLPPEILHKIFQVVQRGWRPFGKYILYRFCNMNFQELEREDLIAVSQVGDVFVYWKSRPDFVRCPCLSLTLGLSFLEGDHTQHRVAAFGSQVDVDD